MLIDTNDLINRLKVKYPDRLPPTIIDSNELSLLVGQQQVVKYIESLVNSLETKNKPKVGR